MYKNIHLQRNNCYFVIYRILKKEGDLYDLKKLITLLILCMLGISLIGCSNSDINSKNATNTSNVKGQNSDKKTYCDDDFIKDIYDLTNDSESDEYSTNTDFDKLSPEEQEKVVKEQIVSSIQDKIDKLERN